MSLLEQLQAYVPYNEQEEHDKAVMLRLLANDSEPDLFTRENEVAHFTASACLVNKDHTKVLMIYHNIYDSWSWTGGQPSGPTSGAESRAFPSAPPRTLKRTAVPAGVSAFHEMRPPFRIEDTNLPSFR